jgi:hypothetical protein
MTNRGTCLLLIAFNYVVGTYSDFDLRDQVNKQVTLGTKYILLLKMLLIFKKEAECTVLDTVVLKQ